VLERGSWIKRYSCLEMKRLLWGALSARRLGVSFRRQIAIGEFSVDLLAPAVRIVIEVDGGYQAKPSAIQLSPIERVAPGAHGRRWVGG
jgi:very-short-patch-repair endonuclease